MKRALMALALALLLLPAPAAADEAGKLYVDDAVIGSGGGTLSGPLCLQDTVEVQLGSACGDSALYFDGTDTTVLQIDDTNGVVIDLGGNPGTTPAADGNWLKLWDSNVGGSATCGGNTQLCIERAGTALISFELAANAFGGFKFGDASVATDGLFYYGLSANATDPSQFRLSADGNTRFLDMGVGLMEWKQQTELTTEAGELILDSAGTMRLQNAGSDSLVVTSSQLSSARDFRNSSVNGGGIANANSNLTTPTIRPFFTDTDMGLGGSTDRPALIGNGETLFDCDAAGSNTCTVTGDLVVTGNIQGSSSIFKSYNHYTGGTGSHYMAGYYSAPATDANLTQASTTVNLGSASDGARGAHAFLVAGGVGSTDGSDLIVTVSGVSITDAGVRNGTDSEVIIGAGAGLAACQINATAASTDLYCETSTKWLGVATFTLSSTGGSTFSFNFNYGFAKYEDFGNTDFTVTDFESVFQGGASDTIDLQLLLHDGTGWTYAATGFEPGGTEIVGMQTDYTAADSDITNGAYYAYKRTGLSQAVTGSGSEGVVIKLTTGSVNAIETMEAHIGITR